MNNYCRNCGVKLENGAKFCTNCSAEVFEDRINVPEKEKELEIYKNKEKLYIILVIFLSVLSVLSLSSSYSSNYDYGNSSNFLSIISPLVCLGTIITLIYARITMNKSKKIKIMFNIYASIILLFFLYAIILLMLLGRILAVVCGYA